MFARMLFLLLVGLLPMRSWAASAGDKIHDQYKKMVSDADLDAHPERNQQLALWCRSNGLKTEGDRHDLDYRRYQYGLEQKRVKDPASAADLKRLVDMAARLKLDAEQQAARGAWLQAELKERQAKLKPDDAAGCKALLAFALKENAGEPAQDLAREVLKLDAKDETAHAALGHLKDGADWIDPWDLLIKKGGLADWRVRVEIFKQIEAVRMPPAKAYAKDPLAGVSKVAPHNFPVPCVWRDAIRKGDGKGLMYVLQPESYDPAKPWPLILSLHGGGSGGMPFADEQASWGVANFASLGKDLRYVIVGPIARNHTINSWNIKENMLDALDAIRDACERFNIDKKRIYVYGASMGGQGTARFSWTVPELSAAFSPQAGAYWNDFKVPDLAGKGYIVFHGDKDAGFRNDSLKVFLDKIKQAKAEVEYVNFPDKAHILDSKDVNPRMLKFFDAHVNDVTPDLEIERRILDEVVKEKPASR